MPVDAVLALALHNDKGGCLSRNGIGDGGFQPAAVGDRAVHEVVQARDLSEIKSEWRCEQLFEHVLVLGLRQKVENAASVVVTDHDGCLQLVTPYRPEAIHVVIHGKVAKQQNSGNVASSGG